MSELTQMVILVNRAGLQLTKVPQTQTVTVMSVIDGFCGTFQVTVSVSGAEERLVVWRENW